MSDIRRFLLRLRAFLRPVDAERELTREIDAHLALLEDDYGRRGLSPEDARRAAVIAIGGVEQTKERQRDERSLPWLEDLRRDVPYAWRGFARSPGFTAVAVITLALGIGANTAIFSIVNALLLKPLGYATNSDRLVRLMAHQPAHESPTGTPRRTTVPFTAAEIADLASRTRTLSHVGIAGPTLMGLNGYDDAARLQGMRVSPSIFPMLGTAPLLGRTFGPGDASPGHDAVMLLSYATWRRYFNAASDIVGRKLTLNSVLGPRTQREYVVVGVMPPEFEFPTSQVQFWMPLYASASWDSTALRGSMLGRLADGVSMEAAVDELGPIVRALLHHGPDVRYELVREQDEVVAPVRPALLVLTVAVGFVLLIACVNVANLLLARTAARQHETAVRAALGAGRGRLIRQALTESVMLSALGGIAGVLLAVGGIHLLRRLATTLARMDLPSGIAFPRLNEVGIDASVLAVTVATIVVTGLLFGLAPALRLSVADPMTTLRNVGRAGLASFGSRRRPGMRGGLVIAQIALALMLVVGAALLMHSFVTLSRVDAGYRPDHVLTFQVGLPMAQYPDARLKTFAEELVSRLRNQPGVRAAAYANQLPMVALRDTAGGLWRTPDMARAGARKFFDARLVSRDYFDVMGIRVVAGRSFTEQDGEGRPRVLLVNEALARRDFAGENPLGRSVFLGRDPMPWEIVGVVADVRQFGLDRDPEPQFFADLRQLAGAMPLFPVGAYYALRTEGDPESLVPAVRRVARELDRNAALFNVTRMDALVAATISRPRMYAVLLGVFAGIGLLLAVVGTYGVMAYAVAQRTREIGIRMALGAQRSEVMALVLRQGIVLTAVGVLLGLLGAAATTRYLEGMLFGVTPLDAGTFASASVLFASVATIAALIPARRATLIDPATAFRCE